MSCVSCPFPDLLALPRPLLNFLPHPFPRLSPLNQSEAFTAKHPCPISWSPGLLRELCSSGLMECTQTTHPVCYFCCCYFLALPHCWPCRPLGCDRRYLYFLYNLQCRKLRSHPWVRKIPWRWKWQPTPVFLPIEFHGQKSLVGYSPWGFKELDD